MITINNFSIIEDGTKLTIDVETDPGFFITSILLWDMDSFKDYTLAKDVSYYLENVNNQEIIIINASDLDIESFSDLWFVEIESDSPEESCDTCMDPALAITYNLLSYMQCSLNEFLKVKTQDCTNCNINLNKGLITSINLLLDATVQNIELGFYGDAIDDVNKLKKLCSINNSCINCQTVSCSTCGGFKQVS